MSFELTNAPATFQAFISNVLQQYLDSFVIVYLDDILIYLKMKEEHVEQVHKVLQALQDVNLQIKPGKSVFHIQEIQFLRFIINTEGI